MREKPTFPEPTPGVPRISHSRAETYIACGVRYLFQQNPDHRRRTTVPIAIGAAVDEASRVDNLKKCEGERLKPAELIEIGVQDYEDTFHVCESDEAEMTKARGKDDTASATREYAEQVSPEIRAPQFVQQPIVADLGGIELAGVPDYCDQDGVQTVPIDLKVGRERTEAEANRSRQLTNYGLLVGAKTGKMPRRVALDSVYSVRRKKGEPVEWKSRRVWSMRTEEDYRSQIRLLKQVQRGIDAGVFLPAAEGDWRCSAKWCEFWNMCEFAQKGLSR